MLTSTLFKDKIDAFKGKPMEVDNFYGHTQAINHAVKEVIVFSSLAMLALINIFQVTAASAAVNGEERRDGWIRSRAENRELMPKFNTKKDLAELLLTS